MVFHEDWALDGLCREYPTVSFFPTGAKGEARAVAICQRCAVIDECRAMALDMGLRHGVFGGMTEADRKTLVRTVRAPNRHAA